MPKRKDEVLEEQEDIIAAVDDDTQSVPEDAKEGNYLVPADTYLKSGIHIGTKFKTKHMESFIYKTRTDGLSVLNIQKIDERIRTAINMMVNYAPEDIIIVCRRENGWKPVRLLNKLTGIRAFAGRYPPGILTNAQLENFMETKLILAVDVWPDRNAIEDALRIGIPVIGLCDTNNLCNNVDLVVPCNNKGRKSLGLFFYLVAREYMLRRGLIQDAAAMGATIEEFMED